MKNYQKSNGITADPDRRSLATHNVGFRMPSGSESSNAQRNYERYLALARAEAQNGNTVAAENYYQHAEHYFRSMSPDNAK